MSWASSGCESTALTARRSRSAQARPPVRNSTTSRQPHCISEPDHPRADSRAVDAKTPIPFLGYRSQHVRTPLAGIRIDRDHDTSAIALVDSHPHAADLEIPSYPTVLGERLFGLSIDEDVRPEALNVHASPQHLPESLDGLY